jgi:hypothetical protein
MIAASLGVWYVLDTAYSLFSGFWLNAVLNTALLALFAAPMAATYGRLHGQRTEPADGAEAPTRAVD